VKKKKEKKTNQGPSRVGTEGKRKAKTHEAQKPLLRFLSLFFAYYWRRPWGDPQEWTQDEEKRRKERRCCFDGRPVNLNGEKRGARKLTGREPGTAPLTLLD